VFRTVRGFLFLAPPAFLAALLAYLSAKPRAVSSFTVYPFLAEVLAPGLPKSAGARFVVVTTLFFIVPYLVAGVVLLLADVGASASAALWRTEPRPARPGPRPATLAPEAFWTLVATSLLLAAIAGARLPGIAHGGELPGGVNVAPAFVAAVPFVTVGAGLLLAVVASIPRAVVRLVKRRSDRARGL
jgi:hypothetical protein